jgi:hypothetical protein
MYLQYHIYNYLQSRGVFVFTLYIKTLKLHLFYSLVNLKHNGMPCLKKYLNWNDPSNTLKFLSTFDIHGICSMSPGRSVVLL